VQVNGDLGKTDADRMEELENKELKDREFITDMVLYLN